MELDLIYLITVVPAILLFGISKAGLGGSVALVSIPLMTIVMPFGEALAITLPILILADFVAVYKFRKEFDFQILKPIKPTKSFKTSSEKYLNVKAPMIIPMNAPDKMSFKI